MFVTIVFGALFLGTSLCQYYQNPLLYHFETLYFPQPYHQAWYQPSPTPRQLQPSSTHYSSQFFVISEPSALTTDEKQSSWKSPTNSSSEQKQTKKVPSAQSLFTPSKDDYPAASKGQVDNYIKALQDNAKEDATSTVQPGLLDDINDIINFGLVEIASTKYALV